ncbi:hypothetical protein LJ707_05750 [Mucilaginibacter sp. UR6-1]|uniref:hypothetical protein n=1 Tax=Mucilaginibacter sp. UR6-1 TaxID=1435643 RepID=UPI001E6561C0|nr:hypothetical protein [Mucilaginibacter sp. UR6-1]MCC8408425.1 hypothetical protein [Mucilaginibacter sp. UR6-1]
MAAKFFKHKWQRVTVYALLVVAVLVVGAALILNHYLKPMLQDKLRSSIRESSDSLYIADFTEAEINLLQGKIVIDNATLKVDTAVYHAKKKAGGAPNNLYSLKVKQVMLTGVKALKFYFSKKIDVGRVILIEPEIDMSYEANNTEDKPAKDNRTIWQRISKSLRSIRVGEIVLDGLKFRHIDYSHKRPLLTEISQVNLHAADLFIDSTTQNDTSRFFYCRDVTTEIKNYSGKTPDALYLYDIKSIKLSTQYKQLCIQGIKLKPFNNLLFFNKTRGDRFNISLDSVQLNRFDFMNYYKYRTFTVAGLRLVNGTINIYKAPNKLSTPAKENVNSFPHVALRNLDFGLRVDTVTLKKLNILYTEYNKKSKKTGTLTFSNTSGRMFNITNNKRALQKNNMCRIDITSYFMGKGRLDVKFGLNLTDKDAAFSYRGSLGPMELSGINRGVAPISMVKVTSGNLKRLDFNIDANRYRAKGKVTMLYDDLKIGILKLDEDDGKLKKKGLMSILANHLVIERNNPDEPGKTPRSANINFIRPVNYAFFKLVWKTLFSGIKECAGVSDMDEKKANSKLSEGDLEKEKKAKEKKKKD